MAVDRDIGIQMKGEELTKTFMMLQIERIPLVAMVYTNICQRLKG